MSLPTTEPTQTQKQLQHIKDINEDLRLLLKNQEDLVELRNTEIVQLKKHIKLLNKELNNSFHRISNIIKEVS